jgi:hypothetical protein
MFIALSRIHQILLGRVFCCRLLVLLSGIAKKISSTGKKGSQRQRLSIYTTRSNIFQEISIVIVSGSRDPMFLRSCPLAGYLATQLHGPIYGAIGRKDYSHNRRTIFEYI